jgi:hypothetical protein
MHRLRRHRRTVASFTASLFLVVWGGMAVAPCLMAAEAVAGEDCPHCPDVPPCHDDGSASCTYVDGYDFDGRDPSTGVRDVRLAVLPVSAEPVAAVGQGLPAPPVDHVPPPDPGGPRLHLRHCVLLD